MSEPAVPAPKTPLFNVTVLFKSGATIELVAQKFDIDIYGGTKRASWRSADGYPKLLHIDLDDIDAVVSEEISQ